jgi:hypothetical protein
MSSVVVALEGAELRMVAALVAIGVRHLERTDGGVQPDACRLRDELAAFARATRLASGGPGRGCAAESGMPDIDLMMPGSPLTVTAAAALLGISEQAVRARCSSGSLAAVKGRGGWEIDAGSAAALAAVRRGT